MSETRLPIGRVALRTGPRTVCTPFRLRIESRLSCHVDKVLQTYQNGNILADRMALKPNPFIVRSLDSRSLPAIPAVPEVPDGRSGVASRRQSRCAQQLQSRRAHTPHGTAASDPSAHARMAYLRLCPGVAHVRICLRHPPDSVRAPPQDPARRGLAGDEARRALGQGGLLEGDAERLGGHRGRTLVVLLLRAPHGRDAEGLRSARGGEGQGAAGRGASREGS